MLIVSVIPGNVMNLTWIFSLTTNKDKRNATKALNGRNEVQNGRNKPKNRKAAEDKKT